MAKIILSFIILLHGLIHLLGLVKAFNLTQVDQLTQEISKPVGVLWLLTSILFLLVLVFYLKEYELWWMIGAVAVLLSWSDAKFGTIANIIIIVPLIISMAGHLPNSYQNQFKSEVEKRIHGDTRADILTGKDIAHLPASVQKYIRYSGAMGKEKVDNFRAVFQGRFKTSPDSEYLDVTTIQYNFFNPPARIFFMESSMYFFLSIQFFY